MDNQEIDTKSKENKNSVKTTTQTCLFCDGERSIDLCGKLKGKPHDEKIEFFKKKGLCYGCLKQGHMSKFCIGKVSCQVCSLTHPTLPHIEKRNTVAETENTKSSETQTIFSAFIAAKSEDCELTGAGEDNCTLAIVPVQVRAKKGRAGVQTYAFLDPGSSVVLYRGWMN